jgi:LysM repeat protein
MNFNFSVKWFILSVIFLMPATLRTGAQVVVEKSKDKVIISGTPYYIHIVKKGETAYSISKEYGITVEELTKENPPAVYGLQEGQALRIPHREVSGKKSAQSDIAQSRRDESRFIYHKLEPGQTVYSISKLYGVSENDIMSANPGIDIKRLPVYSEIAIPRREFMTEKEEFAVQDSKYIFHKVVKGESIASIAEKYGLTVRELRRENRDTRFPQVGDYLRIPVIKPPEMPPVETPAVDTLIVIAPPADSVIMLPRPAGYTKVRDLSGSFDVAVLLPFYLTENADRIEIDSSRMVRGKKIYKPVKRPEEWIYRSSIGFVEMYEGILLAADTLRSLGLNINLYAFDIKSDTVDLTRIIMRGELEGMELIIGPVYSRNLSIVTAYAGKLGIPVVSPVRLMNNQALVNNPLLFIANGSLEVCQNAIAKKVSEYYNDNFVFIHADSAGIDQDVIRFREKIMAELSSRLPFEEIRFKEFLFYNRSAFENDSINRLGHALSNKTENLIIIASEDDPVISETLQEVHSLSKKYPLKVFGYPALRGLDNLEPKFIFDLDILVFSPYWIDYTRKDVIQFNSDFRQKFLTEPTELSYAWLGYDITYYFLSGLAIHGKDFISHPEIHNPDLLQTEFDFRRKSNYDGFENQKLFPVKYTKEYDVRLVPDESPVMQ